MADRIAQLGVGARGSALQTVTAQSLAEAEAAKAAMRATPRELFGRVEKQVSKKGEIAEKESSQSKGTKAGKASKTREQAGSNEVLLSRQELADVVRGMVDDDGKKYKDFQV